MNKKDFDYTWIAWGAVAAVFGLLVAVFILPEIGEADFVSRDEIIKQKETTTTTSTTIQPEIKAEIGTAASAFLIVDIMSTTAGEVLVYGPNGEEVIIARADLDEPSKLVFDQLETGQWYQFEIDSDNTVVSLTRLDSN